MAPSSNSASNARAIVTGASSGIGRAISVSLGRDGIHVLLVGRNQGRLEAAADATGNTAEFLVCDLTKQDGLAALRSRIPDTLDILVHAAGMYRLVPIDVIEDSALDTLLSINLRVPHQLTKLCLPSLRRALGQVVFLNSTQGLNASRHVGEYAATKHALKAVADALRAEVNPLGIRILSMYLGRTATPMQEAIYNAAGSHYSPEKLMQPEDVAAMVLASLRLPRSAEVTDIVMRSMLVA